MYTTTTILIILKYETKNIKTTRHYNGLLLILLCLYIYILFIIIYMIII